MSDLNAVLRELAALRAQLADGASQRPKAVTKIEAARLLSVSRKHIGRMVARGELLTVDVSGAPRVPMSEIDRLSTPPVAASNQGNPEVERRVRFDGAKALAELASLRAKRKKR